MQYSFDGNYTVVMVDIILIVMYHHPVNQWNIATLWNITYHLIDKHTLFDTIFTSVDLSLKIKTKVESCGKGD